MRTDFYQLYDNLPSNDLAVLQKVRTFMEDKVAPIINDYWVKDEFPFEIIPLMKHLDLHSTVLTSFVLMEMARVDPSIATFYLVQKGLVCETLIWCGSKEQVDKWLPGLIRFETIGCFALTEPNVGSGISKDLQTTAVKQGDEWILNGQKKWAGNSTFADISIIWTKQGGFIVENKSKGFTVEKINNKFGLKVVQNGLITLDNVRVPEANRLEGDYKQILRSSRVLVSFIATGVQMGAYEHALKYAKERYQFGKPIAANQLIQDLLAKMLGNITACQCMVMQLGKLIDEGNYTVAQSSLCKAFCTLRLRETVSWAREIFGANGLSIEYNIGRFFTDAEAIYTYEGSYQMNQLIVGKAITGLSAFV